MPQALVMMSEVPCPKSLKVYLITVAFFKFLEDGDGSFAMQGF